MIIHPLGLSQPVYDKLKNYSSSFDVASLFTSSRDTILLLLRIAKELFLNFV